MRVLVVSPSRLAQAGIADLLEEVPGAVVAGRASPSAATLDAARLEPDVVIIHVGSDAGDTLHVIEALASEPGMPVLAILDGSDSIEEVLAAGAVGALPAGIDGARLTAALEAVVRGLVVMTADEVGEMLAGEPRFDVPDAPVERLTPRESEVLQLLAAGHTNAEIAALLGISEHTAKFHVGTVLAKLGARSRAEAVARASRLGWIVV